MHDSMLHKLEKLRERLIEIQDTLVDSDTVKDIDKYTQLNKEFSDLKPIVEKFEEYNETITRIQGANSLLESEDDEIKELAQIELEESQEKSETFERDLKFMLLPKDIADEGSAYLEIRAGAGGDEAGIFAGDLFRMYTRLAEREGWGIEVINIKPAEQGGLKEVVAKLTGQGVFKVMKFESGVHRVQRVPETESQGRIHTSTCTVAILPEAEEIQDVEIAKSDLRVDTYRASGAGGQHVNTTDSAVRIKHLPTEIVVQCQNDRSQHKNKSYAMNMLKSRIYEYELQKRKEKENVINDQKQQIGWGSQIRSYVLHPYKLIKDLRTNHESSNVNDVLDGEIDSFLEKSLSL